jgi:hypothetical protein
MLFDKLALLLLPTVASAVHERSGLESRSRARSHHARQPEDNNEVDLDKRGDSYGGRATFYDVGLGACGWYK